MPSKELSFFTTALLSWHEQDNDRSLPWKSESDPYKIWLSEIILQQTRALQGLPYYNRFTEKYPTISDLAAAPDEDVFRVWQGLGYYNRCKNMLATARYIASELGGVFPDTYEAILALKGIGPYTAAAIASFAFGLPHAVVDGNVYRVLSRYFNIETPIDSTPGKQQFADLAGELLPPASSSAYNQAIMDLGATVCTPRNPLCNECPLQLKCQAHVRGTIQLLPIKGKKLTITTRYFHYLVLRCNEQIWLHRRTDSDIWQSLHEPLLIEAERALTKQELVALPEFQQLSLQDYKLEYAGKGSQRLTHRVIESVFFTVDFTTQPKIEQPDGGWVGRDALKDRAFPKTVLSFLQNNLYF